MGLVVATATAVSRRQKRKAAFTVRTAVPGAVTLDMLLHFLGSAVAEFARRHPRLYKKHKEFFDLVLTESPVLAGVLGALWRALPRGRYKSLYVCTDNKLSRTTELCTVIRTERVGRNVFVDKVFVGNLIKPYKYATWFLYLRSWEPEELEEEIEEKIAPYIAGHV